PGIEPVKRRCFSSPLRLPLAAHCTLLVRPKLTHLRASFILIFRTAGWFPHGPDYSATFAGLCVKEQAPLPQLYPKRETRYEAWLKQHAAASLNWKFRQKM